ncbi:DUF4391 domain-containing protein [Falsiroseomonas ponticola]|uniref:DUF4391 domain-containing protein n=1 Tax=Falsiroseomonas ponticola TaxID=2786951 RepID=UPI001932A82A|nr:DUF4391 domain-containing protein [Roseomonas ponticola]
MSAADDIIEALRLPPDARLDQRVPKKLLAEQGAPTAADRRAIQEGIEELVWVAALKPAGIGIPAYRDEEREYLEIAVLRLGLRATARRPRITELVHRAIPYPVLLLAEQGEATEMSTAGKRWSQGEAGRTVLDGAPVVASVAPVADAAALSGFHAALALDLQPRGSLRAAYEGWEETLVALQAARLSGAFRLLPARDAMLARRAALAEHARLNAEVARLRAAAGRERQMARRVAANMDIQRLEAALAAARARL